MDDPGRRAEGLLVGAERRAELLSAHEPVALSALKQLPERLRPWFDVYLFDPFPTFLAFFFLSTRMLGMFAA